MWWACDGQPRCAGVEGLQHLRVVLKITKGAPVESQLRLKFKAKRQKTPKGLIDWTIRNQTPDVFHTFLRLPWIRLFLHFSIAEFCGLWDVFASEASLARAGGNTNRPNNILGRTHWVLVVWESFSSHWVSIPQPVGSCFRLQNWLSTMEFKWFSSVCQNPG